MEAEPQAAEQRILGSLGQLGQIDLSIRIIKVMSLLDETTSNAVRAVFGLALLCLTATGCQPATGVSRSVPPARSSDTKQTDTAFVGSASCRDCHQQFHELWATSRHGLAMQPYTSDFARRELSEQSTPISIGARSYRAHVADEANAGMVKETGNGGEKTYPIVHVLGGKNAYYFLTPLDKGRLQVLPVAYDVNKKSWYDTAASGVRHFPDRTDSALEWTDRMFTFNTTCFNCHVSQLATNYDLASDTYSTTWAEAGISCESCHGPAAGHVRVMSEGKTSGHTSKDIQIIRTKEFTAGQTNDMCATCHAKMVPVSTSFRPGDAFFDHYDLVTLEHPDYYPDGRDLGENYTYTSWLKSPCVAAGKIDCNHCHAGTGRPRFEKTESNRSCLPCHEKTVLDPISHGHHAKGSAGNLCVSCHMPTTRFAAMGRTDHSMLPPTPATSGAFHSPNACNICHADKDASWADRWVRAWYTRDYQAPVLKLAGLFDAARHDQWSELPAMLTAMDAPATDAVWKASMLSLLQGATNPAKWPAALEALRDRSPLVRSRAATVLAGLLSPETLPSLIAATRDASRLVRIRAAQALAAVPPQVIREDRDSASLEAAVAEFFSAMTARPDDWASHANLGNFHMERRDFNRAISEFEIATRLEPRVIGPLVNSSLAYSNLNQLDRSEASLRQALKIEPNNASALFNLGLLLAETGRTADAVKSLKAALEFDPRMAGAAYNLGVIAGATNKAEAARWCLKAYSIDPYSSKYVHALAFYQRESGNLTSAAATLRKWLDDHPHDGDAVLELGFTYRKQGDHAAAEKLYRWAVANERIPGGQRAAIAGELQRLGASSSP
jgi:tetratricopeptide (TPR) repeat protein